ncbi:hypothetical protein [Brevundimonas sp.]|uniref:hypothetical protein n=1 Tax=Brevundimonas sp. TaxID=1871086 RepID=UPI001229F2FF|nr:hypothetical protein [Brevundimonas sp.]TAJ60688.1 MAG: hypothetical protein EPO49_09210 [Brevundimonas sp.]
MSGMGQTIRTPWHLWVVGVVALLWNGFGCVDYFMTQMQGEAWLTSMGMTAAQIAYFDAMPAWTHAAWAIGVWGGLLGALLLLLRRKWALPVFVASFLGWLAGAIYSFALSDGMEVMGNMWPMQIVIGAACLFFIWYARMMTRKGVLR